jgi:hypothetical protein
MNRLALTLWLTVCGQTCVSAGTSEWLEREFSSGWQVPGRSVEDFLNKECQPSALDGIQMFAIQTGHDTPWNLHIYCRHDRSGSARYRVSMALFPKAQFGSTVHQALSAAVRIGPFRFGNRGEGDGLLLVEQVSLNTISKPSLP